MNEAQKHNAEARQMRSKLCKYRQSNSSAVAQAACGRDVVQQDAKAVHESLKALEEAMLL